LQALASTSSGATAPATPYANQLWYDTATDLLKIRNEANSAWITLFSVSADGFAVEDKIVHAGDTNTSIRFPAADTVTVETDGAERFRVDSAGNVGIGTSSPLSKFSVVGGSITTDGAYQFVGNSTTPTSQAFIHRVADSTLALGTSNTERMRITSAGNVGIGTTDPNSQLHITGNLRVGSSVLATPSGSAPMYTCRAWVKFNGTGTVAINGSGNVSSITDGGTGIYTVNFTTAMSDANYSTIATVGPTPTSANYALVAYADGGTYSTSAVQIATYRQSGGTPTLTDFSIVSVSIFR